MESCSGFSENKRVIRVERVKYLYFKNFGYVKKFFFLAGLVVALFPNAALLYLMRLALVKTLWFFLSFTNSMMESMIEFLNPFECASRG